MSDSEYDSEEDEDYVPEEPASEEEEIGYDEKNRKRKKTNNERDKSLKRKRKGGIKLDEEEPEDASDCGDDESEACEDLEKEEKEKQNEELSKARVDDLWAAFKRDTADVRPSKKQPNESDIKNKDSQNKSSSTCSLPSSVTPKEKPRKVEITEIFDFAGEEVKVVKSVDPSSIKAAPESDKEKPKEDSNNATSNPAIMKKKSVGGLGNVLGKIGKKPKLSTLEKSELDWSEFKKEKGIEDELKTLNRDGYLEKKAFLDRVDHKQFEIERDIRLGVRKR